MNIITLRLLFSLLPFCYCLVRKFEKVTDLGFRSLDGVSFAAGTARECAVLCMRNEYCTSFYYNELSRSCNVDTHYAVTPIVDPQNNWIFYDGVIVSNNVALGKPATQSSSPVAHYAAPYAVDGNIPNLYGGKYCTHTLNDNPSWWKVDLQTEYNIHKVVLVNRVDDPIVGPRLRNFDVETITDAGQTLLCGYWAYTSVTGETIELVCINKPIGRYVKVTLREVDYLSLCEVYVYPWP